MPGVLLIADASGEQLAATTAELVGEGVRLAQQLGDGPVTVLLAGKNVQGLASGLGQLGAEKVLVAESDGPVPPSPQWLLAAAEQASKSVQPEVVLLTHAGGSRDLAASLAYRLDSGIVTDATALRVEGGELIITKPGLRRQRHRRVRDQQLAEGRHAAPASIRDRRSRDATRGTGRVAVGAGV